MVRGTESRVKSALSHAEEKERLEKIQEREKSFGVVEEVTSAVFQRFYQAFVSQLY